MLRIAHEQKQGMFSLFTDFEKFSTFAPTELQAASVAPMFDQLVDWAAAMLYVRNGELVQA